MKSSAVSTEVRGRASLVDDEGSVERGRQAQPQMVRDVLDLTKARVMVLVLVTTVAGFFLATNAGAPMAVWLLVHTMLATALLGGGGAALNQYLEYDRDRRMARTSGRPLPSGRMSPRAAWLIGTSLAIGGVVYLLAATTPLAALVAAVTVILYGFVYTPLKTRTHVATLVGAIPGALPPLIGWAAASGELSANAWLLFGILFFWQLPHFLAIGWLYRTDYRSGGFPMLMVLDRSGRAVSRQVLLNSAALLVTSLLPTLAGQCGVVYFFIALALGLAFLSVATWFASRRSENAARAVVLGSIVYLPILLAAMTLDAVAIA